MINIGPMAVYHTPAGGGTETLMPPTQGGISLAFTFETLDSVADITGNFARNSYYVGGSCTITVNYTEMEMSEVLALFPSVSGNAVTVPIGCSTNDDQIGLVLRPIVCGVVDQTETEAIWAPKVLAKPNFNTEFSLSSQRIWTVEYIVMPADPLSHDFTLLYFGQVGT